MSSLNIGRGRMPRWFSIFFLLMGAYIVLLSFGVVAYVPRPGSRRALLQSPEHWVISCVGIAFFCAGIAIALQNSRHWLLKLNGVVMMAALVASMAWVLFVSGKASLPMQVIGGTILAIGAMGGVVGLVLPAKAISTSTAEVDDPIAQAEMYQGYGRSMQAIEILRRAALRYPHRAAEFHAKLNELESKAAIKKSPNLQLPGWFAVPVVGGILLQAFASPTTQWLEVLGEFLFFSSIPGIFAWMVYQRAKPK